MTIQQKAIEQLERVSRHLVTIGEKEDYTEIAIQALEQECEDAVSRQAVLDIVRFEENWLSDAKSNNADTDIAFSGIRTQVAKLSPVTKALELCEDCISRKAALDKKWDVPYKLIAKEGYNDGYYWDTRYCFELDGKRYIFTSIGSGSGYIPCSADIMEVKNNESLDMLLKDWIADNIDEPDDLPEETAIGYVKRLKESGIKPGEVLELWNDEW